MIILRSAISGGVGFLRVMHLDANTPGCRWRWRYKRLFWYRSENRFQVPLTPLLPEFFLCYHGFADFADLQNIFLGLLAVGLENLVDRYRDVDMLMRIMHVSMWSVWWLWGGAQEDSTVLRAKSSGFGIIYWVCSLLMLASRESCCRAGIADYFLEQHKHWTGECQRCDSGSSPQSTPKEP